MSSADLLRTGPTIDADVLLEGEIHLHRNPGFLQLLLPLGNRGISEMVAKAFLTPECIMALARRTAVGRTQWMDGHMRCGDCKQDDPYSLKYVYIYIGYQG